MIEREHIKPFAGVILVFMGAVFFSAKAVLVKLAYIEGASPLPLLNLRMIISLPFFLFLAYKYSRGANLSVISKSDWFQIIFLGVIGYYLASWFDFEGLKYISAGLERLIVFVYPTLVVLFSAVLLKSKISYREVLALLVTYIGIFAAYVGETQENTTNLLAGSVLVFGSAVTYALYLVGSGKLIPKLGSQRFMSFAMIVSSIAVLAHNAIAGTFTFDHTPIVYLYGFLMALFCTVIPAVLLAEGIKLIGSGKAAIIGSIGPVSTILLANIFLGEDISVEQIAGTVLVLLGVLLVSGRDKRQTVKAVRA